MPVLAENRDGIRRSRGRCRRLPRPRRMRSHRMAVLPLTARTAAPQPAPGARAEITHMTPTPPRSDDKRASGNPATQSADQPHRQAAARAEAPGEARRVPEAAREAPPQQARLVGRRHRPPPSSSSALIVASIVFAPAPPKEYEPGSDGRRDRGRRDLRERDRARRGHRRVRPDASRRRHRTTPSG